MISHLNHRRIYLEEKLKLVEENLARNVEKKKALKSEKNKLIEGKMRLEVERNKMRKQLKICVCLALLFVALVLKFK